MSASDCVVDASVGIKLFINGPLSDTVHDIFGQLTNELPAQIYRRSPYSPINLGILFVLQYLA